MYSAHDFRKKKKPARNLTGPCFNHEDFAEDFHVKGK